MVLWSERTRQQTYAENVQLLSLFTELSKSESAVNQSLLSAYSGSLTNYDIFTHYEKKSTQHSSQILELLPHIQSSNIDVKLNDLQIALAAKWLNVEKFKAHNANLKNSINYLPLLVNDLKSEINPEELHEVLELCYLYVFGVSNVSEQRILDKLRLFKEYADAKNLSQAARINNFCLHVENILFFKSKTKRSIYEIQQLPVERTIKSLVSELTHEYDRRRAFGENVNYVLYFFSIILLFLVVRFLWNLENSEKVLLQNKAKLEDQVGTSAKELLIQNKKLQELNTKNENLIKVLAHDIRSPLSHINGLADVLKNDQELQLSEDKVQYLNHIKSATHKVVEIADDLLISYRPEDKNATQSNRSIVKINEVIKESMVTFEKDIDRKKITLSLQEPDGIITCSFEKTKLYQVLNNLISNAIKFSPRESKVDIFLGLDKTSSNILIQVLDEGPGIPEKERHKLFQEYPNLSPQPTDGETSTGLGLAITKTIVEGLGGRVYHKNRGSKGSTFILEFECPTN